MCEDNGIHLGSLEHVDVLALLFFIRHIVDDFLFLFLLLFFIFGVVIPVFIDYLGFHSLAILVNGCGCFSVTISVNGIGTFTCILTFCCVIHRICTVFIRCTVFISFRVNLIDFKALRQSHIHAVQVLKENIVCHLLTELVVF